MSRVIEFNVEAKAIVHLPDIASEFAIMSGDEQAIILYEFFDALLYKCGEPHKFDMQLSWIATGIERYNFKQLKETISKLNAFLENDKND